ncbi:unnamed protein product [Notodromas monacha]|uniref:Uncharacterized protein n=1 Tax=Notodromas monacha TaxID=399045 RepID=A0A7R9BD16_9CRUS|nr:unnamed protein product [Notodromas monacha]CAG0912413.1 unnamed protein product [Notodromas monacha]
MDPRTPMKTRSKQTVHDRGSESEHQPLEVFCRIKPFPQNTEVGVIAVGDDCVRLEYPGREHEARDHIFTHVFGPDSTQKEVFDNVALPLVSDALKGKSALLFTYGVTGSGKTFTMTGTHEDIGIVPRCVDVVFNSIKSCHAMRGIVEYEGNNMFSIHSLADAMEKKQAGLYKIPKTPGGFKLIKTDIDSEQNRVCDTTFLELEAMNVIAVFASYVENHETKLYDLLDDNFLDPIKRTFHTKKICDVHSLQQAFIKDLTEIEVRSAQEALDVLNMGIRRRTTAATALNSESSRGHAIFTLKFIHTPMANIDRSEADSTAYTISQLSLVDLAGSERLARTNNQGRLRREANHINQSLMTLRQCLDLLRENQRNGTNKPVPFRESKITQLFKGFFAGKGQVRLVVCVNPSLLDFEENLQVLRFAEDAQDVMIQKQNAVGFNPDDFKENAVKADNLARAEDFPITVNLKAPIFADNGGRENLSVFSFNASEMFDDDLDDKFDLLSDELGKRLKVRGVRREESMNLLSWAVDRTEKLLKDFNAAKMSSKNYKEMYEDQKKETDRLSHMLGATQAEREQMRLNVSKQERLQVELANQLRNKEAEVAAERVRAENTRLQARKETSSIVKKRMAEFEVKANEERARREHQIRRTQRALKKIGNLANLGEISSSESDILSALEMERQRERPMEQTKIPMPSQVQPRAVTRNQAIVKGPPVVNPRHRRSLSEGNKKERWLDHQPSNLVPLGTIMNPTGLDKVRRKSVTKISLEDVVKSHHYALTHQQHDSDGDLETHVVKGDVLPTSSGGRQCIFTDVEVLRQKSPTKRPSEEHNNTRSLRSSKMEKYSLKWNSHYMEAFGAFELLRRQGLFVDVTLSCGTLYPIIFFNETRSHHLKLIVKFMYEGEVEVPSEMLAEFLKLAEELEIKGLKRVDEAKSNRCEDVLQGSSGTIDRQTITEHKSSTPPCTANQPESDSVGIELEVEECIPYDSIKCEFSPSMNSDPLVDSEKIICGNGDHIMSDDYDTTELSTESDPKPDAYKHLAPTSSSIPEISAQEVEVHVVCKPRPVEEKYVTITIETCVFQDLLDYNLKEEELVHMFDPATLTPSRFVAKLMGILCSTEEMATHSLCGYMTGKDYKPKLDPAKVDVILRYTVLLYPYVSESLIRRSIQQKLNNVDKYMKQKKKQVEKERHEMRQHQQMFPFRSMIPWPNFAAGFLILLIVKVQLCASWYQQEELELFDLVEEVGENFYSVMKVSSEATNSELKKAFRTLSLTLHPDKNSAPDASVKFRQMVAVHDVLKDAEKRKRYDQVLREGLPDWKQPVFYFRRMRKMGFGELFVLLGTLMTVGHYLMSWGAYWENVWTLSENMPKKRKKKVKGKVEDEEEEDFEEFLQKPGWRTLLPFILARNMIWVVVSIPVWYKEHKELQERRKILRLRKEKEEEEFLAAVMAAKEPKPKKKRVQHIPDFESLPCGSPGRNAAPQTTGSSDEPVEERSGGLWTDKDLATLGKMMRKYPGAVPGRWELIARQMQRTVFEVTLMANRIKKSQPAAESLVALQSEASSGQQLIPSHEAEASSSDDEEDEEEEYGGRMAEFERPVFEEKKKVKRKAAPVAAAGKPWSQIQQEALEKALKKYPKGIDERWEKISNSVPGKTKEDCLERCRELAKNVRKKKEEVGGPEDGEPREDAPCDNVL